MNQVGIQTTQHVVIQFNLASVGDRMMAYIVDELIKVLYLIFLYQFFFNFLGIESLFDEDYSLGAFFGLLTIPVLLYSVLFETLLKGQTLGKRLFKIKVVKIDGYQATAGDYMARWMMRLVDIYSNSALVGLISMVSSQHTQRLGDIVAGTAVITLKNKYTIKSTILEDLAEAYVPTYPLVVKLSDNDMRIIKEAYQNALKSRDAAIMKKLADKIISVSGIEPQTNNYATFVDTILKDYSYYTQDM